MSIFLDPDAEQDIFILHNPKTKEKKKHWKLDLRNFSKARGEGTVP